MFGAGVALRKIKMKARYIPYVYPILARALCNGRRVAAGRAHRPRAPPLSRARRTGWTGWRVPAPAGPSALGAASGGGAPRVLRSGAPGRGRRRDRLTTPRAPRARPRRGRPVTGRGVRRPPVRVQKGKRPREAGGETGREAGGGRGAKGRRTDQYTAEKNKRHLC